MANTLRQFAFYNPATGYIDTAALNDMAELSRLDLTGDGSNIALDLNSKFVIGVPTPTQADHVASKGYVDGIVAGVEWKSSVRAASTGNVVVATPGATIDGVTMSAGNRVLLKDQTAPAENGIYVWNGSSVAMTRAADATNGLLTSGTAVFVEEGGQNADSGWLISTDGAITVGTTSITWTQFTALGQVGAGNGLTKTGSTINIAAADGTITVNADSIQVGVITDTNHGARSGGTLHSVATTGSNGFMSATDKTFLDSLGSSATVTQKYVFAAPNAANGAPSFRALLASDIPTLNQSTTGQAGSVANAVTFQNTAGAASGTTYNGGSAGVIIGPDTIGATKRAGDTMTGKLTTAAGNASIAGGFQLTSGVVKTSPVAGDSGSLEYDGSLLSIINSSGVRKTVAYVDNIHHIGTTQIALNRASASQALTGITSIDGYAASVANALTFNNSGTGDASGSTYNGSAGKTISYNSIGAQPLDSDLTAIAGLSNGPGLPRKASDGNWSLDTTSYLSGTVGIGNGGTGQTTQQAAINALAGAQTSGYYLRGNGTNVVMAQLAAADLNGTIPTGVLGNSSLFLGTTAVPLNTTSGTITSLSGVSVTGSAGNVANAVTFNSSGGAAPGTTFNGGAARTVDYSTVGAAAASHGHSSLTDSTTATASAAVSKGVGLYYSGNATVATGDNTLGQGKDNVIGVAGAAAALSAAVSIVKAGVVTGILTGATAGTAYYMSSTGAPVVASSIASGSRAIRMGYAVNATDLDVRIEDVGVKP